MQWRYKHVLGLTALKAFRQHTCNTNMSWSVSPWWSARCGCCTKSGPRIEVKAPTSIPEDTVTAKRGPPTVIPCADGRARRVQLKETRSLEPVRQGTSHEKLCPISIAIDSARCCRLCSPQPRHHSGCTFLISETGCRSRPAPQTPAGAAAASPSRRRRACCGTLPAHRSAAAPESRPVRRLAARRRRAQPPPGRVMAAAAEAAARRRRWWVRRRRWRRAGRGLRAGGSTGWPSPRSATYVGPRRRTQPALDLPAAGARGSEHT